jgi:hypothetical protein
VLDYPPYNPIRDKFSSLFANVVPGSLKCSFQLDQLVRISLYLMKATALCHSKGIIDKKNHLDVLSIPLAFSAS